jgi:hypothetical protein
MLGTVLRPDGSGVWTFAISQGYPDGVSSNRTRRLDGAQ